MSASVPKYALKTLELLRPFFNMRKTRKSMFFFFSVCVHFDQLASKDVVLRAVYPGSESDHTKDVQKIIYSR